MKIAAGLVRTLCVALLLYLGTSILEDRYQGFFGPPDVFPYARGNASEETRGEVLGVLRAFQEGYSRRDIGQLETFMERLFVHDNVVILGTMPQEACIGFEHASRLVNADWASWGDCSFAIDTAHVSTAGDVAWFATVGSVEFDLTRLLVPPLRLSGVLVRDDGVWRFQYLQFQFDLDLTYLLVINLLLSVLLVVSLITLLVGIVRWHRQRRARVPSA